MSQEFAAAVEKAVATFEEQCRTKPDDLIGWDWWQLSFEEEAVFGIDRQRWPRMAAVHEAYEAFMLIALGDDWPQDLLDRARTERVDIAGQPEGETAFLAFAREIGGLSYREATATYEKVFFWTLRSGAMRFADEAR